MGDSRIDDLQIRSGNSRQSIDGGAPADKVGDHLRRDRLGIRIDAFGTNAVIGCEQDDPGILD